MLRVRTVQKFQSTSPVWGMTECGCIKHGREISIHIPRVGDDDVRLYCGMQGLISIHIPRVGDDMRWSVRRHPHGIFQSTSPVWGMTSARQTRQSTLLQFQSTSPVWGMTDRYNACPIFKNISIHIPRVGDDKAARVMWSDSRNFNPHPPCGG